MSEFKHIHFIDVGARGKTRRWELWSKPQEEGGKDETGGLLGEVKWCGAWWCYAFYPITGAWFEKQYLRDIATFLDEQTKLTRAAWKKPSVKSA